MLLEGFRQGFWHRENSVRCRFSRKKRIA